MHSPAENFLRRPAPHGGDLRYDYLCDSLALRRNQGGKLMSFRFPEPFRHEHGPIKNVNDIIAGQATLGQRAADRVAALVGSWRFIIVQSGLLILWVILNITAWWRHWDPYPFILMNLFLSLQAAYTAPVLMMSQNRLAERDRLEAHNDYILNQKAEHEVHAILEHLAAQDRALEQIHRQLTELTSQWEAFRK
jgi:uncharacterized membrane protein